jgi:cytoskeletal protein RodZ
VNVVPLQHAVDGRAQSLDSAADRIAFGELLRGARERCGISLQQIARETKIPQRHLESLERGQLTATPGGTYTRGEVIAYASVVRLDRQIALAHLERALQPAETQPAPAPLRPDADSTRGRRTAIVAGVGMAILVLVAWAAMAPNSGATRPLERESQNSPIGAPSPPAASAVASGVTAPSRVTPTSGVASSAEAEPPAARGTAAAPPDRAVSEASQARQGFPPRLVIVSNPAGARVTVDGIGRGQTPASVNALSPGARRIRVTLAGYRAADLTVHLRATGDTTVNIALQPE